MALSVYDVATNTGWVSVGTDHDTASFAVNTIGRWWQQIGTTLHPHASQLLICADGGGSNGYRTRLWKTELAALAAATGLQITVCHLPPVTASGSRSSTGCSPTSRCYLGLLIFGRVFLQVERLRTRL